MVSSVGMFGVQKAYARALYRIPILALVSEVTKKPVVIDDEIVARPILTVTATMTTGTSTEPTLHGLRAACVRTSRTGRLRACTRSRDRHRGGAKP